MQGSGKVSVKKCSKGISNCLDFLGPPGFEFSAPFFKPGNSGIEHI